MALPAAIRTSVVAEAARGGSTLIVTVSIEHPHNRLLAFWRSLSDCNQPRLRYLGRALLADLPVTYAVSLALTWLTRTPPPDLPRDMLPRLLLGVGVISPLVETFGMAVIIWILRRLMARTEYLPLVTALLCAGAHSLAKPLWGVEIFWSFVIFSLCFTAWEKKSFLNAFWMTAGLHALHNLLPTLGLLLRPAG